VVRKEMLKKVSHNQGISDISNLVYYTLSEGEYLKFIKAQESGFNSNILSDELERIRINSLKS